MSEGISPIPESEAVLPPATEMESQADTQPGTEGDTVRTEISGVIVGGTEILVSWFDEATVTAYVIAGASVQQ